ncbi:O-antigen ligase family protein, partial [bacterium]|nr:O-antigen ligase family protein [bacterium]
HILLLIAAAPVFLSNWGSFHALAVLGLFLILLLLVSEIITKDHIFIWLAWSAMLATILSFYQHWSTAYGVVQHTSSSYRMSGVLGQANLLACLMVVGLFAWLQSLWQKFDQDEWRWFHQIPVVFFFWALLLTGSKAGLLAFSSSMLLLGLGLARAGKRDLLIFFAVQFSWSLALGLVLFLFVQAPGLEPLNMRAIDFNEDNASTGARLIYWCSALGMGFDHLLNGVGIGGYRELLGNYMVPVAEWLHIPYDAIGTTLWAHNDFLHIFAECGLMVFLILLFVFARILYRLWPSRNPQALFCFCAIWAFFVCMQFEHPFNDHVLVFYLVILTVGAIQLYPEDFKLKIPKKLFMLFLIPCLFFINFYIIAHAIDMYSLKNYFKDVVKLKPLNVEQLTSTRAGYRYQDIVKDPLTGWVFKFTHMQTLGDYAVKNADR